MNQANQPEFGKGNADADRRVKSSWTAPAVAILSAVATEGKDGYDSFEFEFKAGTEVGPS